MVVLHYYRSQYTAVVHNHIVSTKVGYLFYHTIKSLKKNHYQYIPSIYTSMCNVQYRIVLLSNSYKSNIFCKMQTKYDEEPLTLESSYNMLALRPLWNKHGRRLACSLYIYLDIFLQFFFRTIFWECFICFYIHPVWFLLTWLFRFYRNILSLSVDVFCLTLLCSKV